jgi:hypothetical protein
VGLPRQVGGSVPERIILGHLLQFGGKQRGIARHGGHVVAVQALPVTGCAHHGHALGEGEKASRRLDLKARPVSRVLFRPEEVDPGSSVGELPTPVADREIHIGADPRRVLGLNDPVPHHHAQGIAAVQTGGLDHGGLAREEPADR